MSPCRRPILCVRVRFIALAPPQSSIPLYCFYTPTYNKGQNVDASGFCKETPQLLPLAVSLKEHDHSHYANIQNYHRYRADPLRDILTY